MKSQSTVRFALAALLLAALLPWQAQAQSSSASQGQATAARVQAIRSQAATGRSELAAQRTRLQGKPLPALALTRHDQLQAEFDRRSAEFERAAAAWQADPSDAKLRDLDAVLNQHGGASTRAPSPPRTLPWGAPKTNSRMPAESQAAWYRLTTRDERVQLAQVGLTTLGGIRFSSLPEAGQAPADADLAETGEIVLTPAIRAKAAELGGSPVAIANWVRANVQFAPTWGASQSADATLRSLRGNAIDTTTLTIALLRASGIPARYQFGTVDVPAALAMNWLGGLAQPEAALELLAQGGIAARGLSDAGVIKTIRMEHAWASAYVYWNPNRGARPGGAALQPPQHPSPNAALNAWVPLDASYKPGTYAGGTNLAELAPFNAAAALDAARHGASCTAASAAQINQAALAAHYAQFKSQAQQQLAVLGADTRVSQVLGASAIAAREQALLPGTLPFAQVIAQAPTPELAAPLRWRLQLSLLQGTTPIFATDKSLPELEGQLLSLAFVPETEADAQILAALLRPDTGGDAATGLPARIAAYLVRVKAQLRANGHLVAEGGSFTLGQPLTLRTLLQNPQGNAAAGETLVPAGETHAWAVHGQAQIAATPAALAQRLTTLKSQLDAAQLPAGTLQASELLHGVASSYLASLDAKARLYQRVANTVVARLPGVTRASSRLEAEEAYGLILNVRPGGVGLQADRLASAVASRSGTTAIGYSRQSLERASAEAHQHLNRLFGATGAPAQSALSGLAFASAQGQSIWRADAATLAQVLGAVDTQSTVRAQVEQAVANGMQALVATSAVDLGGLPMDPLVLLDPLAGGAAFSVASRQVPVVQVTAQRPGLIGWLGLADAQASKLLVAPALDAALGQLNTAQALLGDIDSQRWQAFGGQADVLDGLYQARLSEAASITSACDWLISTLVSQLGGGLPASGPVNRAPVITSQPVTTAQAEAPYSYQVLATDPDNDPLAYNLTGAPTGMVISTSGRIDWPRAVPGQFALTVQVSDGKAITEQRYTLAVGAAGSLQLQLALSPGIANPGQSVTLSVTASSSAGAVTRTATLDGAPLALNAQGQAVFAAPAAGAHPIVVTASDGVSTTSREVILTVKDPGDTTAPGAAITSPEADAGLRGVVTISGTATDAKFAYYQLLMRRVGEPDTAWQEFGRGLTQVSSGALGQVDTSRFDNGLYQIALRVVDVNGAQSTAGVTVEFLGNLKLGQFRLSFADVRADALGLPLMLTRTYDSSKKDIAGDFGWGWSASGQDVTLRKNMALGLSWEVVAQNLQLCLRPVGKRRISITLPDGGLYRFDAKNAVECGFGQAPAVDIQYTALPGPTGGAAGRVGAGAQLKAIDGALVQAQGGRLIDEEGNTWNPVDFELTTEEGFKYRLKEGVGIQSVTDPFGNQVTYGAAGYQHSANLGLTFIRDAQGRITRATDPAGRSLTYAYNAQGELETVTDRDGKTTRFTYATVSGPTTGATSGNQELKHLLASITDPRGRVVMSNQFDQYGRLTGTADGLGQAATQQFDAANFQQVVTDRRGNRTVYTFDADGNITRSVNALGQTTTFTFDANGNETSVTNALGHTITRTFDPATGKQLSERNHLGHTTSTQYLTVGATYQRMNPLSTTDARGNTTEYRYEVGEFDTGKNKEPGAIPVRLNEPLGRSTFINVNASNGNLQGLNIAGEVTSYVYDGQGRRVQETNGLGQRTTYAYDANGNEVSRTVSKSINGTTQTFTTTRVYDAENRLTEETDPLGGKRTTTYNAAGKVATQTDSLGRQTKYTYDGNARLTKTEYPDGTSEATAYDPEGNEASRTDRQGRTRRMEYDALNRLVKTIYPDGSSDSTEYDPAGRVVATVDRKGKRSTVEYDEAGRQTASVDATGRRTSQAFDANGNRTSVTVDGRTTSFEYDALNRLTKTTWPDGSTHTSVYRTDNRKQSETDARGVTTAYGYDLAGRLTSVAQSLSATATATTSYSYDETGAKTTQVDALGRTTTWALDGNGRITSRTIQDGTKETSRYDAEGNRLEKISFAGETITYQYDTENRVTGQIIPSGVGGNSAVPGSSVIYSYSASGQLISQQEQGATSLNGTQSYRYDANDRLIQMQSPIGQISYGLDAAGNVVERSASSGNANAGTTRYEHDETGRLLKVIAADGKQARYFHDAAGRIERVERDLNPKDSQAQVLVTYSRYDSADRLVAVAEVRRTGSTDTLLAGQALTRVTGGTISKIETYRAGSTYDGATGQFAGAPARTQGFEYDGNARLKRETITKDGSTADSAYEYDAAGNRRKKTVTTAAGVEITTYDYDHADRLVSESTTLAAGGSRQVNYGWDGNGNLASRTEPGMTTLYRFDPHNRLIDIRRGATQAEASAASPSVSYGYDASGNRIRKTTAQGGTGYLIDSTHAYAQVAAETTGSATTAYVRGVQLIRQSGSGGQELFPMHGHLGTSLGAVDASGDLVEQTEADAFGKLDHLTGIKQSHLYTGEYWDQDSQLLYLRARWYDPRIGRFISADPYEGKQRDPRSLNRYVHANSDPIHRSDPSGRMSLAEVAIGIGATAVLAGAAYHNLSMNSRYGPPLRPTASPPFSITAGLLMPALRLGLDKAKNEAATKAESIPDEDEDGGDLHHTIPIYLCGAANQMPFMPRLPGRVHRRLHKQLAAYSILTEGALELGLAILPPQLQLTWRGKNESNRLLIHQMASYPSGRAAIAEGLKEFYDFHGYSPMGLPPENVTVAGGLLGSTPPYVEGTATSIYMGCRRPRTLK